MAEDRSTTSTDRERHETPGTNDDVRGGAGRKDEVGRSGIYPATGPYPEGEADVLTPGEINSAGNRTGSPEGASEELKQAERLPRRGNEEDKPFSDQLGD